MHKMPQFEPRDPDWENKVRASIGKHRGNFRTKTSRGTSD